MTDYLLVRHCSPTLAGLKAGSLFSCPFRDRADMAAWLAQWDRQLSPKGVRALALRYREGRGLVYVYRPALLTQALRQPEAAALLRERGYVPTDTAGCLRLLTRRLAAGPFPHEIGLFLGYPPEDVRGFIRDVHGQKYAGYWKVYGDVDAARRTFETYKRCTELNCALYLRRGVPPEQLTVPGPNNTNALF